MALKSRHERGAMETTMTAIPLHGPPQWLLTSRPPEGEEAAIRQWGLAQRRKRLRLAMAEAVLAVRRYQRLSDRNRFTIDAPPSSSESSC
jgi:hypothetical protein